MAETVRAESLERLERVRKFAIQHMENTGTFPTARPIQTKFLEHQYPGNLNSIASDLKVVAKDISLVYQSKQTVDVDGEKIEIPREALEYTVRAYQLIELQQRKNFDQFKEEVQKEADDAKEERDNVQSKLIALGSELEAKSEVLQLREEQLQEIKEKLAMLEQQCEKFQTIAIETEKLNDKLASELATTKQHLNQQQEQHEKEVEKLDKKLNTLQDKYESRVNELHEHHNSLVTEHEFIKVKYDDLGKELTHTEEERNCLKEENKQLEKQKVTLVHNMDSLKASNNALADERKLQTQQINELRCVIDDLNSKVVSFETYLKGIQVRPKSGE